MENFDEFQVKIQETIAENQDNLGYSDESRWIQGGAQE